MSVSIEQRINYLNLHQLLRLVIIGIVDLIIDSFFLSSSFTAKSLLLATSIFTSLFFLAFFIINRVLSNLASFFIKTRRNLALYCFYFFCHVTKQPSLRTSFGALEFNSIVLVLEASSHMGSQSQSFWVSGDNSHLFSLQSIWNYHTIYEKEGQDAKKLDLREPRHRYRDVFFSCWPFAGIEYSIPLPWLGVFKYINQCCTALAGGI